MKCPDCNKGDIRVMNFASAGGEYPLVCDGCFAAFFVKKEKTFPPDSPDDLKKFLTPEKAGINLKGPDAAKYFTALPLLEDFKRER